MRATARQRQRLPLLTTPIPTFDPAAPADPKVKAAEAKLRAALTRFETAHGADALICLMKAELERRGEARWLLDKLAPKPGKDGQTSLLDAGR
jgi:hypothetical protein